MKKNILIIGLFSVSVIVAILFVLNINPIEEDYKLKFVNTNNFEVELADVTKFILPFDIYEAKEVEDKIVLKVKAGEVVYSPIECKVVEYANNVLTIQSNNVKIIVFGIICGVKNGQFLNCGDVIGTIKDELIEIELFIGGKRLSLDEIKQFI